MSSMNQSCKGPLCALIRPYVLPKPPTLLRQTKPIKISTPKLQQMHFLNPDNTNLLLKCKTPLQILRNSLEVGKCTFQTSYMLTWLSVGLSEALGRCQQCCWCAVLAMEMQKGSSFSSIISRGIHQLYVNCNCPLILQFHLFFKSFYPLLFQLSVHKKLAFKEQNCKCTYSNIWSNFKVE